MVVQYLCLACLVVHSLVASSVVWPLILRQLICSLSVILDHLAPQSVLFLLMLVRDHVERPRALIGVAIGQEVS